jgi:hypothetical protein
LKDSADFAGGQTQGPVAETGRDRWQPPDLRRALQLALAGIWLLDAILQFQPTFFTKVFANEMIRPLAPGNPDLVARSISSVAGIIGDHPAATNTPFALIQVFIALGIAWRPTVKVALGGSVVWAVAVWWFGEGLGGVLNGGASPLNGAPGAVILYALLAFLLWPTRGPETRSSFVAAGLIGEKAARVIWVVLWGGLAFFAIYGANRSRNGLHDMISSMAPGEPGWLASVDDHVANVLTNRGLAGSIVIAILLGAVALRAILPNGLARASVVLGIVASLAIWVIGENFGTILAGGATDPNSGPLLILIALAYWPRGALPTRPSNVDTEQALPQFAMEGA